MRLPSLHRYLVAILKYRVLLSCYVRDWRILLYSNPFNKHTSSALLSDAAYDFLFVTLRRMWQ